MFKREALSPKWCKPRTWRNMRFATLKSSTGLDQGSNGDVPIWLTQDGEVLRRGQWCDEVEGVRIDHTGWFTDGEYQCDKARGIVVNLPHGRWIAGYHTSENDERVYFPEIHESARDAAHMADEHARVIGEQESEHAQKYDEAQKLETDIADAFTRLRECVVLRHRPCMEYARDEISTLIQSIREMRDTLKTDYAGVL